MLTKRGDFNYLLLRYKTSLKAQNLINTKLIDE